MESLEAYKKNPEEKRRLLRNTPAEKIEKIGNKEGDVSIAFDGKEYISARRASEYTGYNQDYVGQLARSGKILSRQVGNRWYVDHAGILKHKEEKDSLLAGVQSRSLGIDTTKISASATNKDEPELLSYLPEDNDLTPRLESKSLSSPSHNEIYSHNSVEEDNYKVPIHIIRKDKGEKTTFRRDVGTKYDSMHKALFKKWLFLPSLLGGILILLSLWVILNFTLLSRSPQVIFDFIKPTTSSVVEGFANAFEEWISPEISFHRTR
jgi:hypothetical protein